MSFGSNNVLIILGLNYSGVETYKLTQLRKNVHERLLPAFLFEVSCWLGISLSRSESGRNKMKTLWRLIILGFIALVIYFMTIGRNDLYSLLDFAEELIQLIAGGYLKK